jgi:GT2 family glycosyltransferase
MHKIESITHKWSIEKVSVTNLSIVIVNWNGKKILSDCLDTLTKHVSSEGYEVIVVDNGSTDGSVEMVKLHSCPLRLIENTENMGFAYANNQGFEIAVGKYVLLLNSDTLILGDVLQESVKYMDNHDNVGVLGCRVLNSDFTLQRTCARQPNLLMGVLKTTGLHRLGSLFGFEHYDNWLRDSEREVGVVTGCYLMTRRSIIESTGGLDEQFFFNYEETDFCRRVADRGWRVTFSPVGEIIHLGGGSSGKDNPWREFNLAKGKIQFFRKHSGAVRAFLTWIQVLAFWKSRYLLSRLSPRLTRFSTTTTLDVIRQLRELKPAI